MDRHTLFAQSAHLRQQAATAFTLAAALLGLGLGACASVRAQESEAPFYLRKNGSFYHYVREGTTTFSSISTRIREGYYAERGIDILTIYCPYHASGEWRGVPAIDFFDTNPNTGTVADFEEMVSTAHAHGMYVIVYMGLLFVDQENPVWIKAQNDKSRGIPSTEAGIFRWEGQDGAEPALAEVSDWRESDIAGLKYAASWQHPALDLASPAGRKYVESVIKFWLDKGIDGMEFDSPPSFWGGNDEVLRQVLVELPKSYTSNPKYLIAEGSDANAGNQAWNDRIGFTHVLLSGDDDQRSVATDVMNGRKSIDDLESHFARYIDGRRERGLGVRSVSLYDMNLSAEERAFEAAVLAGNGSYMEIDYDEVYKVMGAERQRQYDAVFKALAGSTAEAPGAGRKRLSSSASPRSEMHYAVLRTSPSGMERAVNVYNFSRESLTIAVDLRNSGIADGETAFDLRTQQNAAQVQGQKYTVELPGLGYAFLRFGKDPEPEPMKPQAGDPNEPSGPSSPGSSEDPDDGDQVSPGGGTSSPGPGKPASPTGTPPLPQASTRGGKVGGHMCSAGAPGSASSWPAGALLALAGLGLRRKRG